MKKLKEAADKYLVHLIFLVLFGIGAFVWDYANRFFNAPDKIEHLEKLRKSDSLIMVKWKLAVDSTTKTHDDFIKQDWKVLNRFGKELGLDPAKIIKEE